MGSGSVGRLAGQDTASLNVTAHTAIDGLGPIARRTNGAQGLLGHDTLAFSTEGTPLGLVDVQALGPGKR